MSKKKLLFLSGGNVKDIHAQSGSSYNMYHKLSEKYDTIPIDTNLKGLASYLNILHSFDIDKETWKSRLGMNIWSFNKRSNLVGKECETLRNEADGIFQFGVLLQPPFWGGSVPYFIYTDYTNMLARKEYIKWAPFRTEKEKNLWFKKEQEVYKNAAHIFTFSNHAKESIIKDYNTEENKVSTVGAGVHYLSSEHTSKIYDGKTILFVGNDFNRKGGEVLIKAFQLVRKEIPEAVLYIVGPKEPIRGEGIIHLFRVKDREKLKQLFIDANVFAMPSICEPFGYVFLEAMTFKVPCIGTNTGAMPDIIEDGRTGYVIDVHNSDILAKKIIKLLKDSTLSKNFGDAGSNRVRESFTWDIAFNKIFNRMKQLME